MIAGLNVEKECLGPLKDKSIPVQRACTNTFDKAHSSQKGLPEKRATLRLATAFFLVILFHNAPVATGQKQQFLHLDLCNVFFLAAFILVLSVN